MSVENAILIRNKTRLEVLIERFNSASQARFYINQSGGDFSEYEVEHSNFYKSLEIIEGKLSRKLKVKVIEKSFLPTYIFSQKDIIVVAGQDGLVANAAKYVDGLPIIAVNPDPSRYDGVLLPYNVVNFSLAVELVISEKYRCKIITMAEASLHDGQRLLAFNDIFIGPASHTSARYKLSYNGIQENQSSSGVIVSTGAGSTGWLSSIFNMASSINHSFAGREIEFSNSMDWDTKKLIYVVREPFLSKVSKISLSSGIIDKDHWLTIESHMPVNGDRI
jgi:NAD kinase